VGQRALHLDLGEIFLLIPIASTPWGAPQGRARMLQWFHRLMPRQGDFFSLFERHAPSW